MTNTPEPAFRSLDHISRNAQDTSKLAALSARIAELEAQLYAVGAGGVGQSIKPQIQADTAPQPTRQPLTDEQILSIVRVAPALDTAEAEWLHVARAIEAAASNQARQPLTNEQIIAIADNARAAESGDAGYILPIAFARAIEASHGITGGQQ